jgi:coenzyme F420 hydrogenase subunit beta
MLSQNQNKFNNILKHNLCLGCGLCEAIGKNEGYIMSLNGNGFYKPKCIDGRNIEIEKKISEICPAININAPKLMGDNVWGGITNLYNVSSSDSEVRKKGSSGGGISALCIYILENKIVDGVLHVGKISGDSIENQLFISRNRNEVLLNASSRYAPAKVFNEIKDIFENTNEIFAFVGKPCDIAGLKNYIILNPQYQNRIKCFFSFFCAGMPSYDGTLRLLEQAKQKELPYFLKYRGDGWPGYFKAMYKNGSVLKISYEESWGKVLSKHVHPRCKICPDGIGLMADNVFGDAWETKDGYPDFEEREGKSLVIARTELGDILIKNAFKNKNIIVEHLKKERISKMQPYQYQRRLFVGYRIVVIQILTMFLLNFKGTGYLKLMAKYPIHKGIKNSIGTLRRFLFNSRN